MALTRVRKVTLQKILGNLVWAAAIIRSGKVFFNRLLALLRKLNRPFHSIYFAKEAKKDLAWWVAALKHTKGSSRIPPSVWTPLFSFFTDASLEGCGMVFEGRALVDIFTLEHDHLDINKKEMLAVMVAINS